MLARLASVGARARALPAALSPAARRAAAAALAGSALRAQVRLFSTPEEPRMTSLLDLSKALKQEQTLRRLDREAPAADTPDKAHLQYRFRGFFLSENEAESPLAVPEGSYMHFPSKDLIDCFPEGLAGETQQELEFTGLNALLVRNATKEVLAVVDAMTPGKPRATINYATNEAVQVPGYTDRPEWQAALAETRIFGKKTPGFGPDAFRDGMPSRILLTGDRGTGKSTVLNQAVHYARKNGWIVFFVPDGWAQVNQCGFVEPSRHYPEIFQSPLNEVPLLKAFLHAHYNQLKDIKIKNRDIATKYEKFAQHVADIMDRSVGSEEGAQAYLRDKHSAKGHPLVDAFQVHNLKMETLADLVVYGCAISTESGSVVTDLISELRQVDEFPVLFAVDGYNAWHSPTNNYFAGEQLTAQQLAIPRALNFLTTYKKDNTPESYPMKNGLCIAATSAKHPVSDKMTFSHFSKSMPYMIKVPQYNKVEFLAALQCYSTALPFLRDYSLQEMMYLRTLTNSNPKVLRESGLTALSTMNEDAAAASEDTLISGEFDARLDELLSRLPSLDKKKRAF